VSPSPHAVLGLASGSLADMVKRFQRAAAWLYFSVCP
jgi:hypothetical protein